MKEMDYYTLYPAGNNNERKRLGLPMIRRVHVFKERKKWYRRVIDNFNSYQPGYLVSTEELLRSLESVV